MAVYRLASAYQPNEKLKIPLFKDLKRKPSTPSKPSTSSTPSKPSEPNEKLNIENIKIE
jgi:hypothetical protein